MYVRIIEPGRELGKSNRTVILAVPVMLSGGRRADARALCLTAPHSSDGRLVTRCAFFQGLRVRDERGLKHAPKSVAGDPVQSSLAWGQPMPGKGWTKEAVPPCPTGWRGGKRNGWAVILSCLGGGRAESGRIAISGRMMSMDRSSQRGPCGNGVSRSYLPTQPSSRHGGRGSSYKATVANLGVRRRELQLQDGDISVGE